MNLNQTNFVFITISRDFRTAVAIMVNDFEINKIFIKKRRSRSFKSTSRPLSPKGDSEGIGLDDNYQGLNKVTAERLPVSDSTQHENDAETNRYSSRTNKLPKLFKPTNGDSRKQLSQRIALKRDNLDGDDFERGRSKDVVLAIEAT